MALKIIDKKLSLTTTTNATIATLMTIAIPAGAVVGGLIKVTVRDTTNVLSSAFYMRQISAVNNAGTASIIGSLSLVGVDAVAGALATILLTASISGTDLLIRGTGILATNLEWQVDAYLNVN